MNSSPSRTTQTFLQKYEFIIPLALFIVFLALTLPGIAWGAPNMWHPDEVVYISIRSLNDNSTDFDASNFNHPHLPIYAMLGLGKIVFALGGAKREVLIAARVLSTGLAGLTIVLAYYIPRRMGYKIPVSGLSGLLLLSVSEMTHNGRFAHNDTFVTYFSTLTIFFLVLYKTKGHRGWLYATFYSAGLAISSKYSAISLAAVPFIVYLWTIRNVFVKDRLRVLETLFIGGALVYLGYATGTPKALTWMAFYMKRLIPALVYNSNYWVLPDSVRGVIGQYAVFRDGVGISLFLLFGLAFLWGFYKLVASWKSGSAGEEGNRALLLLLILVIDLPIMISYNYPTRFFLPLMPLFAILGALFITDMYALAKQKGNPGVQKLVGAGLTIVVALSLARSVSVMSLFMNDSRIPASKYIETLPLETSLEYTYYPPSIPKNHFGREYNYPVYFIKSADDEVPITKRYEFNVGEIGLDQRQTNYLVVDSFTTAKFADPYICETMQVECDFFKQLGTGQSNHYKLIAEFSYSLPAYLPQISISFVNPGIRIYERIK